MPIYLPSVVPRDHELIEPHTRALSIRDSFCIKSTMKNILARVSIHSPRQKNVLPQGSLQFICIFCQRMLVSAVESPVASYTSSSTPAELRNLLQEDSRYSCRCQHKQSQDYYCRFVGSNAAQKEDPIFAHRLKRSSV